MANQQQRASQPGCALESRPLASVYALLLVLTAVPIAAQLDWRLEDGSTHSFPSHEAALRFLETAEVAAMVRLEVGITRPYRITLEQDGIRARAVFRIGSTEHVADRSLQPVRDSYDFEVAAYRLARLIDLANVPPTTRRTIGGVDGTVQLWVEDALTGAQAMARQTSFAAVSSRERQRDVMRVFDSLVNNLDRHQDNQLFDELGRLWYIDHTRAFRASSTLRERNELTEMPASFIERLEALDKQVLRAELGELLTPSELKALHQRSKMLAKHLRRLLRDREKHGQLVAGLAHQESPDGRMTLASSHN